MRVIDITKGTNKSYSSMYMGAPVPMYICYSNEEVDQFHPKWIFRNIQHLSDFIHEENYLEQGKIYNLVKHNIWIATGERYKPDYWTNVGQIVYQLDGANLIPTDNCYVQLIALQGMNNWQLLATSSGLYKASILEWSISAAEKMYYSKIAVVAPKINREEREQKVLRNKKVTAHDVKFVHYLLNDKNEQLFGNVAKAARAAYPLVYSKDLLAKLVNSEKIRELLIKEIKMLFPNYATELQQIVTIKKVGEHMNSMLDKSIEKGTTDDQIHALEAVLKNVYSEPEPRVVSPIQNVPLIDGAQPNRITLAENNVKALKAGEFTDIHLYEDEGKKVPTKDKIKKALTEEEKAAGVEDDSKPPTPEKLTELRDQNLALELEDETSPIQQRK